MKKSTPTPLLARFTQLFRKSGGESPDGDSEHSLSAVDAHANDEAFKQLIKHKRRNDAIRAFEFNQLRNTIRDDQGQGDRLPRPEHSVPPNARGKHPGSEVRTSILDKIDGAEAHLDQWWGSGYSKRASLDESSAIPIAPQADGDDLDLDFTGMQELARDDGADEDNLGLHTAGTAAADPQDADLSLLDSGLRDAALLFAEGEFDAAQSVLLTLLSNPETAEQDCERLTRALFDLYRCAGQQERFEALALDYANRFGRSPEEWFSVADTLPVGARTGDAPSDLEAHASQASIWKCPSILDAKAFAECVAYQNGLGSQCAIDWLPLQHMDANIADAFGEAVEAWSETPLELHWLGVDSLMAALQMCRVSGNLSDTQPWWLIQLNMHRILGQPQIFDELAVEYCLAFEVSPPSWRPVRCTLAQAQLSEQHAEFAMTVPNPAFTPPPSFPTYLSYELNGNILGEDAKALRELITTARSATHITVACSRLGRVDLRAAAALRSWAYEYTTSGGHIQFTHLPRLVLIHFEMLGMPAIANLSVGPH